MTSTFARGTLRRRIHECAEDSTLIAPKTKTEERIIDDGECSASYKQVLPSGLGRTCQRNTNPFIPSIVKQKNQQRQE